MKFEFLLLDLDDTILDFHKAEYESLGLTLESFGLNPTDEVRARYSQINKRHWELLERKELTREQVLVGRFSQLFAEYGITVDPEICARRYESNLATGRHHFLPGAEEALKRLAEKYKLYIVSNGTAVVQDGKLASANISRYFEDIFISQRMGADKPDILFFERCFARIPNFDPKRAMIVGDSLSSDIKGGIHAGVATCWVNTRQLPGREDIQPDYEIEALSQLEALLETL